MVCNKICTCHIFQETSFISGTWKPIEGEEYTLLQSHNNLLTGLMQSPSHMNSMIDLLVLKELKCNIASVFHSIMAMLSGPGEEQ